MTAYNPTPLQKYVVDHPELLMWRDYVQELLTIPERIVVYTDYDHDGDESRQWDYVVTAGPMYNGKLVVRNFTSTRSEFVAITHFGDDLMHEYHIDSDDENGEKRYAVSWEPTGIPYLGDEEPLVIAHEELPLPAGKIANYPKGDVMMTTFGRFFWNYWVFAQPFGDIFPYYNQKWKPSHIQSLIYDKVRTQEVTRDQYNAYANNMYAFGSCSEFCVPNITRKALTKPPEFDKIRDIAWKKYGPAIESGDAVAMSQYEQELITYLKENLKGDEATDYLTSGKVWNVVMKNLFATKGMVEQFGNEGQFDFVKRPLEEGWDPNDFPVLTNNIRSGSYSRAMETAKGGEESKFILRVFQNTRIVENDCKTKRTLDVLFGDHNSYEYVYRNAMVNGKLTNITKDNHTSFVGKVVKLRSPMYCSSENGYCYTCMGELFKDLGQNNLATVMNSLAESFTTGALKKMHGTSVKTVDVSDINKFLL